MHLSSSSKRLPFVTEDGEPSICAVGRKESSRHLEEREGRKRARERGWKDARARVRPPRHTPAWCFFIETNAVIRDASRVTRMRERERKESQKHGEGEGGRESDWKRERESVSGPCVQRTYVGACVRACVRRVRRGRNEGGYFCGAYRGRPYKISSE